MACISESNVVKLDIFQRLDAQEIVNSMYYLKVDPWSTAQALLLCATWWDYAEAGYFVSGRSNEWSMVGMRVTDMTSPTGFVADYIDPSGVEVGGQGEEPLPNNVAMVVQFRTNTRGRNARGRNYLAGWGRTAVNNNTWGSAVASAVLGWYEGLATEIAAEVDAAQVVYSCQNIDSPEDTMGVARGVTEWLINPTVASQRKRLPGRGR